MMADDFADVLAVEINIQEGLNDLFDNRLPEMLSTKEGLFPDSEGHLIYHQIMDLRSHIINFGPISNAWSMPGERAMRFIKNWCTRS
jgi:hypothetical protein